MAGMSGIDDCAAVTSESCGKPKKIVMSTAVLAAPVTTRTRGLAKAVVPPLLFTENGAENLCGLVVIEVLSSVPNCVPALAPPEVN